MNLSPAQLLSEAYVLRLEQGIMNSRVIQSTTIEITDDENCILSYLLEHEWVQSMMTNAPYSYMKILHDLREKIDPPESTDE